MDEHYQDCLLLEDEVEEGEEGSNSKACFKVPKETKIMFQEMKDHNLQMGYTTGMDVYSFPTQQRDNIINDSTAPVILIPVLMDNVQRILNTRHPKSDTQEDKFAFDEDRKATTTIIDIDSFWRFQNTPKKHQMISLPADIHDFFCGDKE